MKFRHLSCMRAYLLIVMLAAATCQAEEAAVDMTAAAIAARVDAYLGEEEARSQQRYSDRGAFSGAVVVALHGEPIVSRAFGYANREWWIPNTIETKFRLWSVTKIFTATAIMKLQEQGKLQLNDHICKYIDRCADAWKQVTIRQLLTHTSGLPEMGDRYPSRASANRNRMRVSAAEMIERQRVKPMDFAPGTHFAYNNFGFYAAGLVIERVAGKSYEQALSELVLRPAGMGDTGVDRADVILPKRASNYTDAHADEWLSSGPPPGPRESLVNAEFYDMQSWMFAAGALYSTVQDVLKFDRALTSGALLRPQTLEQMWTPIAAVPLHFEDAAAANQPLVSKVAEYGIGWETHRVAGRRCFSHMGAGVGGNMFYLRFPDEGLMIVVLPNSPAMGIVGIRLPGVIFGQHGATAH